MAQTPFSDPANIDYRQRLLDGMAAAIVEKGYAETTIADIVRHARVSKRTFYEHFPDKQACLLACYSVNHQRVIHAIATRTPADSDIAWDQRLLLGLRDFLSAGETQLALMRTLMVEILAAGREGLRARREVHKNFSELLVNLIERERCRRGDSHCSLSPSMATAIVSGIHEVLLNAYEDGRGHNVKDMFEPLSEFISTMFRELELPPASGKIF